MRRTLPLIVTCSFAAAMLLVVPGSRVGVPSARAEGPSCPGLVDESVAPRLAPTPTENGNLYPVVVIHGITGSADDFKGTVDLSMTGTHLSTDRSLIDGLVGLPGADAPVGLPHVHVYSFSYTSASLRWVDDAAVGFAFAAALDCLYDWYNMPVSVVAHSMGGLVTRWVSNSVDEQGYARSYELGKVVTLGTPYLGSDLLATVGNFVDGATLPLTPYDMLLKLCGFQGSVTGSPNCQGIPFLSVFDSVAGQALRRGSPQIAELQPWADVDVTAIVGDIQLRSTLFGAEFSNVSLGDIAVATDSASADSTDQRTFTCRYSLLSIDGWTLIPGLQVLVGQKRVAALIAQLVQSPCYHSHLMRSIDVNSEVLGSLNDWLTAMQSNEVTTTVGEPEFHACEGYVQAPTKFNPNCEELTYEGVVWSEWGQATVFGTARVYDEAIGESRPATLQLSGMSDLWCGDYMYRLYTMLRTTWDDTGVSFETALEATPC